MMQTRTANAKRRLRSGFLTVRLAEKLAIQAIIVVDRAARVTVPTLSSLNSRTAVSCKPTRAAADDFRVLGLAMPGFRDDPDCQECLKRNLVANRVLQS